MSPRSEPVRVGFLHNSGLSRPNTSYLWKSNRKNKEMFLLCGKGVILSWGNPKRLKVDVLGLCLPFHKLPGSPYQA